MGNNASHFMNSTMGLNSIPPGILVQQAFVCQLNQPHGCISEANLPLMIWFIQVAFSNGRKNIVTKTKDTIKLFLLLMFCHKFGAIFWAMFASVLFKIKWCSASLTMTQTKEKTKTKTKLQCSARQTKCILNVQCTTQLNHPIKCQFFFFSHLPFVDQNT